MCIDHRTSLIDDLWEGSRLRYYVWMGLSVTPGSPRFSRSTRDLFMLFSLAGRIEAELIKPTRIFLNAWLSLTWQFKVSNFNDRRHKLVMIWNPVFLLLFAIYWAPLKKTAYLITTGERVIFCLCLLICFKASDNSQQLNSEYRYFKTLPMCRVQIKEVDC